VVDLLKRPLGRVNRSQLDGMPTSFGGTTGSAAGSSPGSDRSMLVTGGQLHFGGVIDEAVLTGEFADYMAARLRAGVRNGIAGWHGDELALLGEWGFALDDPALPPVAIWQGDQDRMVPYPHGEWLACNMADARAHLMPGEGHLSLVATKIGYILDDLTDMAGL
jgi:pimeloyl-ACP methyl ester carboxylesterase